MLPRHDVSQEFPIHCIDLTMNSTAASSSDGDGSRADGVISEKALQRAGGSNFFKNAFQYGGNVTRNMTMNATTTDSSSSSSSAAGGGGSVNNSNSTNAASVIDSRLIVAHLPSFLQGDLLSGPGAQLIRCGMFLRFLKLSGEKLSDESKMMIMMTIMTLFFMYIYNSLFVTQ
jgi:hypothetical protein